MQQYRYLCTLLSTLVSLCTRSIFFYRFFQTVFLFIFLPLCLWNTVKLNVRFIFRD